jgi:uncharacterized membrane protein
MEKMLVVVFDNELKAYDGYRALSELDAEDSISVHAKAVIMKNAEGQVILKQEGDEYPIRTVGGTAIGALVGLLGGPIGVGVGAMAGAYTGSILDLDRAGVDTEFLDDATKKLTSGKWAIVADISEDWETPVDDRMVVLGGTVFRATRQSVENKQYERDVAAINTEISQLEKEEAKAETDRKVKIRLKIDALKSKRSAKLDEAKQRIKQQQDEAKAKIDALKIKAAKSQTHTKAKIEARIAQIKEEDERDEEEFEKWLTAEDTV